MCSKPRFYTSRRDAREILLRQWRRGDWRFGRTVWCGQHQGWHLAAGKGGGHNPLYVEGRR